MTRLFTFGCSFTSYGWPTWADIIAQQFDQFQNWGRTGAGNAFIFHSVIECLKRNNVNSNDVVAVMWSGVCREDRFTKKRGWITPGSIYNQTEYSKEFVDHYVDYTGCLMRDLSYVSAIRCILETIGCRYYFTSMIPFEVYDDARGWKKDLDSQIIKLYQDEIDQIRDSVYTAIFNSDWYSKPGFLDHNSVKQQFGAWHHDGWPSWDEFVTGQTKHLSKHVLYEINEVYQLTNKLNVRVDIHPTPAEHLEYVQKVLPEFEISNDTIEWVNSVDQLVRNRQPFRHLWKPVSIKRF
jgi:hypothetical protein